MPAPAGTSTAFRLARIAALVLGSLLFLYACENSKSALLADKWVEVAIAGALLAAGLGAAWFEIKLTDYREDDEDELEAERAENRRDSVGTRRGHAKGRAEVRGATHGRTSKSRWIPGILRADDSEPLADRAGTREFLVESEGWSMRAKIARSGDLVFHGHDLGGTYPPYEWMWVFHPETFPDIRTALGDDEGEILELLEEVVPQLDRHGRHDPGAWLRTHDIPATYREKGVSATQETRELPIQQPGLPRPTPRRAEPISTRAHRNELPAKRSRPEPRNAAPLDEESAPIPATPVRSRRDPITSGRSRYEDVEPAQSPYDEPEPARARRDPLAPSRSRHENAEPARSPYDEPEPARPQRDPLAPSRSRHDDSAPAQPPYDYPEPARAWRDPLAPSRVQYEEAEPVRSPFDEPEPAHARWRPAAPVRLPRAEFEPARSPYEDAAPQAEPARSQWPSSVPARSREDFGPTPYEEPARWEDEPAPHYEDPAPHWPVRDDNARPPLERRTRSQPAQPANEWSRDDDAPAQSPYEDPADAWARRRRLDAIQSQLEQPSPEQPSRAYHRETAQPQYDSRRGEPDLPLQRRGSSALPHDYAESGRYEQPSPPRQRPAPNPEPSWPERSMPRQRQTPREQPRDDYTRPWTDQPDEPPARRRRSSPPPNSAGSGRHATSQSATPPWP
ncbi:hypothetical protein ACFWF7_19625 [Nocardia sp. NPDC060256]|uniref:hypothetical protein n=1 Tax=unclassified Nocardia TaxID=2637762 RepID=UPI00364DF1D0